MKRLNRKKWERFVQLANSLDGHFREPARQSVMIWRGDYRAIQWAREYIASLESAMSHPARLTKPEGSQAIGSAKRERTVIDG